MPFLYGTDNAEAPRTRDTLPQRSLCVWRFVARRPGVLLQADNGSFDPPDATWPFKI